MMTGPGYPQERRGTEGTWVVLLTVALTLAACSPATSAGPSQGAESVNPSATGSTATSTPTSASAGGTVTRTFVMGLTAKLPGAWTVVDDVEGLADFDYRSSPDDAVLYTMLIWDLTLVTVHQDADFVPWPDDLRPWLISVPYFHDIGEPAPVTVAGIAGTTIDALVDPPPDVDQGSSCYHLIQASGIYWNLCPNESLAWRVWTLDRGDGTGLAIVVESEPDRFVDALQAAQVILDSLAF